MAARVRAWLLLALFLGAGTSLPSADALLHHLHPDPFTGRVHVEPAGGCTAHSDHCTLGRTPPGSRAVASFAFLVRLVQHDHAVAVWPLSRPRADVRATLLPPSRAPPAPLI
ncbi:MAG: hypothetical protein ACREOQ_09080 [Gemmatimonadales bacterium]